MGLYEAYASGNGDVEEKRAVVEGGVRKSRVYNGHGRNSNVKCLESSIVLDY